MADQFHRRPQALAVGQAEQEGQVEQAEHRQARQLVVGLAEQYFSHHRHLFLTEKAKRLNPKKR